MADPKPSLAERLLAGDKRALARGISLVEDDDPEGWELVREVYPHTGKAAVVGFTGPPGAGKSTLIGALIKHQRALEREVAVLSIDPSSPFRGGALLGDRIRLSDHFLDPGVFIRSMATRGALGGLAEAALQTALLMDAAGKDDVFLETVGVGQAEVDVIDHADSVVLVLIPGSGDSIQALKAGVMEIPDIIVVNKSDHPLTDTMVREIRGVLSLGPQEGWRVPIIKTEAVARHRDRGARREARRAPRVRRGRGHAVRAPAPQPDERGAGPGHHAPAAGAGGVAARGPRGGGAARRGRGAAAGSRQRRQRDPRPRGGRGRRRRPARPAHATTLIRCGTCCRSCSSRPWRWPSCRSTIAARRPARAERRRRRRSRSRSRSAPGLCPTSAARAARPTCPAAAPCAAPCSTSRASTRTATATCTSCVDGGSITLPGMTAIDIAPDLRPRRDPRVGDRVSAAGPVQTGSYGQAQIHALELRVRPALMRNWAGNYEYRARTVHRPASLEELQEIVARAPRIRALGSRHSFTDIADSDELVALDGLPGDDRDRRRDRDGARPTCATATSPSASKAEGLALHNLASLPHISVAGAIATATHGSGDATATSRPRSRRSSW